MKKILFLLAFAPLTAFALLPPIHQSVNEIKAILDSQELAQAFSPGETIQLIKRKNENTFIIKTEKNQMVVGIVYSPQQKIGPHEFKLVFENPTPIK